MRIENVPEAYQNKGRARVRLKAAAAAICTTVLSVTPAIAQKQFLSLHLANVDGSPDSLRGDCIQSRDEMTFASLLERI